MQLAYVTAKERGATDACLAQAVALLSGSGLRLVGGVQHSLDRPGRVICDMELTLLPDGPALMISQDLGPLAEGCRLDADALETAVAEVQRRMPGAQALVVNKFGKQEQIGRGFVPLIAQALEAGIPVLVGVNAMNLKGFLDFAGDIGVGLPADPARAAEWLRQACSASV
jgi:Protein of unknown function (DUF2478)